MFYNIYIWFLYGPPFIVWFCFLGILFGAGIVIKFIEETIIDRSLAWKFAATPGSKYYDIYQNTKDIKPKWRRRRIFFQLKRKVDRKRNKEWRERLNKNS